MRPNLSLYHCITNFYKFLFLRKLKPNHQKLIQLLSLELLITYVQIDTHKFDAPLYINCIIFVKFCTDFDEKENRAKCFAIKDIKIGDQVNRKTNKIKLISLVHSARHIVKNSLKFRFDIGIMISVIPFF